MFFILNNYIFALRPPAILAIVSSTSDFLFQLQYSVVDLDQALFQPFPSEIIFQNYSPCEVYEVPLVLRNNDKVSMFSGVGELFQDAGGGVQ